MQNIEIVENALKGFPFDSQDGMWEEAICSVVFGLGSNIHWYIIEGEREGNDILMFGIVIGWVYDEFGYVSLKELLENPWVYHLTNFKPIPLKEIDDDRLQQFLKKFKH